MACWLYIIMTGARKRSSLVPGGFWGLMNPHGPLPFTSPYYQNKHEYMTNDCTLFLFVQWVTRRLWSQTLSISPPTGKLPFLSPPSHGGGGVTVDLTLEVHRVVLHYYLIDRPPYQHRTLCGEEEGAHRADLLTESSWPPTGTYRTPPALLGHCPALRPCFSQRRHTFRRRSSWRERSSVCRHASEK